MKEAVSRRKEAHKAMCQKSAEENNRTCINARKIMQGKQFQKQ